MAKRDRWRGAHRAQHLVFEVARRPPPQMELARGFERGNFLATAKCHTLASYLHAMESHGGDK